MDWVRGNESLTFKNLTVVYQGTTDKYPPDEEFDVIIIDDDTNSWLDTNNPGGDLCYLSVDANGTTDAHQEYIITLHGLPIVPPAILEIPVRYFNLGILPDKK